MTVCGSVRSERCCLVKDQVRSPQITHVSWGRLEVEGRTERYKDAKLFPGGSREWNWRETGTEHVPGFSPPTCRSCWTTAPRLWCFPEGWRNACGLLAKPLTS